MKLGIRLVQQMGVIAGNIAMYLECLAPEALGPLGACAALVGALDALLRAAALLLHQLDDVLPLLRAATAALRIPAAAQHKVPRTHKHVYLTLYCFLGS